MGDRLTDPEPLPLGDHYDVTPDSPTADPDDIQQRTSLWFSWTCPPRVHRASFSVSDTGLEVEVYKVVSSG